MRQSDKITQNENFDIFKSFLQSYRNTTGRKVDSVGVLVNTQ